MGGLNHAKKHGAKDLTGYRIDPERPIIVSDPAHRLHDPSSPTVAPEWMIASVDKDGVLVPGRMVTDGNDLLIADGRTRLLAAREANKRRAARGEPMILFPYVLDDGSDEQQAERVDKINHHRRMHSPIELAEKIAKWKARGYSNEQIVELLPDVPLSAVDRYHAVNRVDPKVRTAIANGEIPWSVAFDLQNLSREEQVTRIAEIPKDATVREAKARVKAAPGEQVKLLKPMTPGKISALRERLVANDLTEMAALVAFIQGEEGALEGYPELASVAVEPVEPEPERDPEAPYGRKKDGTPKAKPGKK